MENYFFFKKGKKKLKTHLFSPNIVHLAQKQSMSTTCVVVQYECGKEAFSLKFSMRIQKSWAPLKKLEI